jgi:hypothetical protein
VEWRLAADVAGYSRLMGRDEERTLAQLKPLRKNAARSGHRRAFERWRPAI